MNKKNEKPKVINFKKGDWVAWESQSGSYDALKVGRVIAVVPVDKDPANLVPHDKRLLNTGAPRTEKSYLVNVHAIRRGGVAKLEKPDQQSKLYWPKNLHLREAKPAEIAVAETFIPKKKVSR